MEGKLVIVSAPSGAGKTTIVNHLLISGLNLSFSISATTRQLRGTEIDGKDYFFLPVPEFKKKIKNDDFVEWEEVYKDLFYGTLKNELERIWAIGHHVLFDVDVKGGINLKKKFGTRSIAIFIMPPSIEELEKRLITRGTDCPSKINMRIEKAREELELASQFDNIIINDDLEKAKNEAFNLISVFINN
ncbi:MAG TPA: guanylate kinase [Bacteroidales bacterium]|nr:guanylate kinase [Bacteroidales bacterium]HUX55429.1 guanylate kinase [Bacteroidales bacterium]